MSINHYQHDGIGLASHDLMASAAAVVAAPTGLYPSPSAPPPSYNEAIQWPNSNISSQQAPQSSLSSRLESRQSRLDSIIRKYEITEIFARKLVQRLNSFRIVFVFDDSGSMLTRLDESPLNHGPYQVIFQRVLSDIN